MAPYILSYRYPCTSSAGRGTAAGAPFAQAEIASSFETEEMEIDYDTISSDSDDNDIRAVTGLASCIDSPSLTDSPYSVPGARSRCTTPTWLQ